MTNPPTPTQAVSEPVAESAHEFKSRLITDACSKWSGSQKVEAGDIIEWIADYRVAASTTASASEPACKTCGGKRLVPDGYLYGEGGVEFSEPIACTKDCPDCSSASVAGAGEAPNDWYERHQAECTKDYGEHDEDAPLASRLRWWAPKSARHGRLTLECDLLEASEALATRPAAQPKTFEQPGASEFNANMAAATLRQPVGRPAAETQEVGSIFAQGTVNAAPGTSYSIGVEIDATREWLDEFRTRQGADTHDDFAIRLDGELFKLSYDELRAALSGRPAAQSEAPDLQAARDALDDALKFAPDSERWGRWNRGVVELDMALSGRPAAPEVGEATKAVARVSFSHDAAPEIEWLIEPENLLIDRSQTFATLYAAGAQPSAVAQPLPVEAIHRLWDEHFKLPLLSEPIRTSPVEKFARALERAHSILPSAERGDGEGKHG